MQGFTGKPAINKKSKSLKRKVDDLLQWKEQQERKREEEWQRKRDVEMREIEQMQMHKGVSRESERLMEGKGVRNERVEERLSRDARIRKKKAETWSKENSARKNEEGGQGEIRA